MPTQYYVQHSFTTPNEDITDDLLDNLDSPTPIDNLVLYFGEGEYFLSEPVTINVNCNVLIKGCGKDVTKLTLLEGDPFVIEDTRITIKGSSNQRISVEICNINISTPDHSTIWWDSVEKHLIKIEYADDVKIHDIISRCSNAVCTNIDMRVCSNIFVTGCELVNYNNSNAGGVLWMRHETCNVRITNNRIVKYGNDEMLAFWLPNDAPQNVQPSAGIKENIIIADNDIVYEKPIWASDLIAGVQISLFNDYNASNPNVDVVPTKFSNFCFVNNRILISAPITNLIGITFGSNDTHDRIVISNNSITCTDTSSAHNSNFALISVTDKSSCHVPVIVEDNVITSAATTTDLMATATALFSALPIVLLRQPIMYLPAFIEKSTISRWVCQ